MAHRVTAQMAINEQTQARCRRDGGPLVIVRGKWAHQDKPFEQTYSPRVGRQIARDIEYDPKCEWVTVESLEE